MKEPELINGEIFEDERGVIYSNNKNTLDGIKRYYIIEQPLNKIRAWQGHMNEEKQFKVISGRFLIAWKDLNSNSNAKYLISSADDNSIIKIPSGFANGLMSLAPQSKVLVLSNLELNQSLNDKIRFKENLWLNWEKFKQNEE